VELEDGGMTDLAIPDILAKAAELIRRNGWHQGALYDQSTDAPALLCDRAVDTYGAINLAVNGENPAYYSDLASRAVDALADWLVNTGRTEHLINICDWNDAGGNSVEQVLAALEGAAQSERERAA
jgi:hypothetical protein